MPPGTSERADRADRAATPAPTGAVLLVAGYGAFVQPAHAAAAVSALGKIGEAFLEGGPRWSLQRLAPGEPLPPTRLALRRAIDDAARADGPCVIVLVGLVLQTVLGPAMSCAPEVDAYPEDSTLPLGWIGDRLRSHRGAALACVLIAEGGDHDRRRWLAELSPASDSMVAVSASPTDALDALQDGVWGEAVDPRTGTVTTRSLAAHLSRRLTAAVIHPCASEVSLVTPAPVTSRHDPRLSRLVADHAPSEPAPALVGRVLSGRFRVDAELGRGGFGVVYRAHHDLLGRDFALKVVTLREGSARADAAMFLDEVRAIGRLNHPNLVRVHIADVLDRRRMFFTMELLEGPDLQRVLDADGALRPSRAVPLLQQLLAGLAAAHEAGLVHADVKPANIIVLGGAGEERLVLVDFGLARLRAPEPTRAAGGTAAYMAPEQRRAGVVDPRTDLYAAACVALAMLLGRASLDHASDLASIGDATIRGPLARALAEDPAERFATAHEMSAALRGEEAAAGAAPARLPFRHAAPFAQQDADDFQGRDREISELLDAVLFRRVVIYTAPSGAGKTSLLRAGLLPRLEELGVRGVYLACRPGAPVDLDQLIATSARDAAGRRAEAPEARRVVVIDQIEALMLAPPATRSAVFERAAQLVGEQAGATSLILSVREDLLALLIAEASAFAPGPPLRLGLLTPDGARQAVTSSLRRCGVTVAPELLDALIIDLAQAARGMPTAPGRDDVDWVYPPHLRLVCAVLYEALPTASTTLTLESYLRLGRLPHILGEHLHRVLEGELTAARIAIARELLLALVGGGQTRAVCSRADLMSIVAAPGRGEGEALAVIEFLQERGLIVALPSPSDDTTYELAHDTLVPRIEAWVTATDLARRRALELIRHRLRRSDGGRPSLLDVGELRDVARDTSAADLARLDDEWSARPGLAPGRAASTLVARSRRAARDRRLTAVAVVTLAIAVASALATRWQSERAQRRRAAALRDRDIGAFALEISAYDLDADGAAHAVSTADLPALAWRLHRQSPSDPDAPGDEYPSSDVVRGPTSAAIDGAIRVAVRARGGPAVLVVSGRGRRLADGAVEPCAPSIIPVRWLPGYSAPGPAPTYRVRVPTCAATRAGAVVVPAGPFVAGGGGEPVVSYAAQMPPEQVVVMTSYAIDRTEVTNAAFAVFAGMSDLHRITMPDYPGSDELRGAGGDRYPASFLNWSEARAYCRYLGKDLPTLDQWDRALRGGLQVGGHPNRAPRRTFAWEGGFVAGGAAVPDEPGHRRPFPVARFALDVTPEGVVDMVGNLQEWTLASAPANPATVTATTEAARAVAWRVDGRFRITRGCNWSDLECAGGQGAVDFVGLPNLRPFDLRSFAIGFRCATAASP